MIPLFSTQQVRAADNFAINKLKIPGIVLMENAAISIKNEILREFPFINAQYCFGIICGKGNNGGDGFAVARQLLISGYRVIVISLASAKELKGDALINYTSTKNLLKNYNNSKIIHFRSTADLRLLQQCDVIIDAILGTGSTGELREPYKSIVSKLKEIDALKIAVDTPTGLNLQNSSGENIFKADLTVTLAELKTGIFYGKGKHYSGKTVKGSIGIGQSYFDQLPAKDYLVEPEDVLNSLPERKSDANKYSAGKVLIIAGSGKMPGAGIFAINSAMVSGAGAGFLAFPESIKSVAQSQMNSAIVYAYEDDESEYLRMANLSILQEKINLADAVAIGPGLGREDETQAAILELLKSNRNKFFVIDADAIFALRNKKYKKLDLRKSVFTPHHKEFADLLGINLEELELNLLEYGRKFVKETKAFLVLKGAPTIIFNPVGEVFINTTGNSSLAKFGTGDVLTGIITSFISQSKDIEKSLIASVYLHSLTADILIEKESEYGVTPLKLIEHFPETIKFVRNSVV